MITLRLFFSGCLKPFTVIVSRVFGTVRNDEFPAREVLLGCLKGIKR
ncbi:MAG: hypothetical protein IKH45_04700 [Neisseriaceae bacterium]|nr:hypothetical protein [Neisseriaceae bacterium]